MLTFKRHITLRFVYYQFICEILHRFGVFYVINIDL